MLFNSLHFLLFFPIVFLCYYLLNAKHRWKLLLVGSYYFYMCWDVSYILLILITTLVSYWTGLKLSEKPGENKLYLWINVIVSLGILFVFKYFNFFNSFLGDITSLAGGEYRFSSLELLLPVGISFYTFQVLSYNIDIYRGQIEAEKNIGQYALYISFFPQLVAGPIERASNLLPQLKQAIKFDYDKIKSGLFLMGVGMFKKVVIADNLARFVDPVFNDISNGSGIEYSIAAVFFVIQIYCDFSGYSDIAIGCARTLGIDLMQNFKFPYIATSITDIWRRWHISLSTWVQDYIFNPLAMHFRNKPSLAPYIAIFVSFILVGLWHGAAYTYILFGFLQSIALAYEFRTRKLKKKIKKKVNPWIYNNLSILFTLLFWTFSCIYFRANTVSDGNIIIKTIFSELTLLFNPGVVYSTMNSFFDYSRINILATFIPIVLLFVVESIERKKGLEFSLIMSDQPKWVRWTIYFVLGNWMLYFGVFRSDQFIYFQF